MRQLQRELSSAQRKSDAVEWNSKIPELPEDEIRHHLCRDEWVVERHRVLYKDINM